MFAGIGERIELTHRATDRVILPQELFASKGFKAKTNIQKMFLT